MPDGKYELKYLSTFIDDFNAAVDYISISLSNPIAAENFIDSVENAIIERQTCAEAFAPYPSKRKRRLPYYYIPVGNFCVFYVIEDNVMEVRRLLYGRRNIDSHLE